MPITRSGDESDTPITSLTQRVEMRVGDDLPGFAAIIEDELGNPIDLTAAAVFLILTDERSGEHVFNQQIQIINPIAGVVQHDWDRRVLPVTPGYFSLHCVVDFFNVGRFGAPSDRSLTMVRRPAIDALS